MYVTQKCCILIKIEKKSVYYQQLVCGVSWFCLIFAYRLKRVILRTSVGRTALLLFESYLALLYMKVTFIYNLLKFIPIYHLEYAAKSFPFLIFFEKKVPLKDPSDRITQVKTLNRIFFLS